MSPAFIIIGAQKAGTTTLYDYIIQHPFVSSAFRKETKYFDLYYNKPFSWYKAFFPVKSENYITGEATPDYFFYEEIPPRIKRFLPTTKFIVLLRNPVDRTISQYNYNVDRGVENLPLETALKQEPNRMKDNFKIKLNSGYVSNSYREFSYTNRGMYARQLKFWLKYFPLKQFFVCSTGQMKNETTKTINDIYEFLDLKKIDSIKPVQKNASKNNVKINAELSVKLNEVFKIENEELFKMIGKRFSW